jgi:hypothetical protein
MHMVLQLLQPSSPDGPDQRLWQLMSVLGLQQVGMVNQHALGGTLQGQAHVTLPQQGCFHDSGDCGEGLPC